MLLGNSISKLLPRVNKQGPAAPSQLRLLRPTKEAHVHRPDKRVCPQLGTNVQRSHAERRVSEHVEEKYEPGARRGRPQLRHDAGLL